VGDGGGLRGGEVKVRGWERGEGVRVGGRGEEGMW